MPEGGREYLLVRTFLQNEMMLSWRKTGVSMGTWHVLKFLQNDMKEKVALQLVAGQSPGTERTQAS